MISIPETSRATRAASAALSFASTTTNSADFFASGTLRRAASIQSVNLKPGGAAGFVSVNPTKAIFVGFSPVCLEGTSRIRNGRGELISDDSLTMFAPTRRFKKDWFLVADL